VADVVDPDKIPLLTQGEAVQEMHLAILFLRLEITHLQVPMHQAAAGVEEDLVEAGAAMLPPQFTLNCLITSSGQNYFQEITTFKHVFTNSFLFYATPLFSKY